MQEGLRLELKYMTDEAYVTEECPRGSSNLILFG